MFYFILTFICQFIFTSLTQSNEALNYPQVCPISHYKSALNTSISTCEECPKGTYNYHTGNTNSFQCNPCPSGMYCPDKATQTKLQIHLCPDGYICERGTVKPSQLCPAGYFCPEGTSVERKYDNKCPKGFICFEGTKDNHKHDEDCPLNYYCPPGSKGIINKQTNTVSYAHLFTCPFGTWSENQSNLFTLLQCLTMPEYTLLPFTYVSQMQRMKEEIDYDKVYQGILDYYLKLNEFDITTLEAQKFSTTAEIDERLNTNRQILLSVSPLIPSYGMNISFTKIEHHPLLNSLAFPQHFYYLHANSYALVTFDFRHLTPPNEMFINGVDWEITFKKYDIHSDLHQPNLTYEYLQVPEAFINKTNNKTKVHEFVIFSLEDIYLSININIYNGIYASYFALFNQTATIEEIKPQRAELQTSKFFGVIFERNTGSSFNFPVNLLQVNTSLHQSYDNINDKIVKNYISYASGDLNVHNEIQDGMNSYDKKEDYWGTSNGIGLTFIPYVSNCKGYGKYIPLWALLEQNEHCVLVNESDTVYISDFSFGKYAHGDTCDIELECLFDEDVLRSEHPTKNWFHANKGEYLFSLTQNPIELKDLLERPLELEHVDVNVETEISSNELPRRIEFTINYFQKTKTLKKIIDATISFKDPVPITKSNSTSQQNIDSQLHHYRFIVKYSPYSHSKLMIAFALSYKFYLVLFIIQGFASIIMVLLFFWYHRAMSRIRPIPKFHFWSFFPLIFPPAFIGLLLAVIPLFTITTIIAVLCAGNFLFVNMRLFTYINKNGVTYFTPFDFLSYFPDKERDITTLRKGRLGTALFALGMVLIFHHTNLVVASNEPLKHERSFDNNRWDFITWKRFNVYYVDLVISAINIYYIMLSFSGLWSNYIWYFIYSYKIIGIVLENVYEELFKEQLFISGFPCIFNLIQTLITFGAINLTDFLQSVFIEQGSLLIEKVYIEAFTNYLKEHKDEYVFRIKNSIKRILKYDLEVEPEKKTTEEDEDYNVVILTDDEEEDEITQSRFHNNNNNNHGDMNDEPTKEKGEYEEHNDGGGGEVATTHNNYITNNNNILQHLQKNNPSLRFNGISINTVKIEEFFDAYKGFASDMLSYFYNIVFYFILWCFYSETQILENYGVSKESFLYFYFFIIISVPFSIFKDIVLHNLMELNANIPIHDFLDYMQYRYNIRQFAWCLDDPSMNFSIGVSVRKMYKLCFSSQYYYLKTLYVSGLLYVACGVVTLMLNSHNIFADVATMAIFPTVMGVSKVVQICFTKIAEVMRIWDIEFEKEGNVEKKEGKKESGSKCKVKGVTIKNWSKVREVIKKDQLREENLKTNRIVKEVTKKKFVAKNKRWLQNEIDNIITARTLIMNKDKIIKLLRKKYYEEERESK